ncbi:hypothetical protein ZOSMA_362G00040 [Zostera marina]|uniref:Calmodulin-binding domain-containing protein n=1 Tax=Zostera marina TaxID=29655 RepID=A0A0K9P8P2_ZOSMR|nr:hypothetical protein ZOSMA_362G00040 [Zostera marina]
MGSYLRSRIQKTLFRKNSLKSDSSKKTDDREIPNSDSVVILTETCNDSPVILSDAAIAASSETHTLEEERASIKIQAVYRDHMARRSFRSLRAGIIKLQAPRSWASACLVASIKIFAPVLALQIEYFNGGSNSTQEWLERWTHYQIWKPLQQPKKTPRYAMETKSGSSSKRVVKHNLKNVKRNSRRVTNSGDGEYYIRNPTVETIEMTPIGIVTPERRQYRKGKSVAKNDEDRLDFCEMMNQAMKVYMPRSKIDRIMNYRKEKPPTLVT